MRKAKVHVSLEMLAIALFNRQVEVLAVEPSGDYYVALTIEGAAVPESPDGGETPTMVAIVTITAPMPPPKFEFRPAD